MRLAYFSPTHALVLHVSSGTFKDETFPSGGGGGGKAIPVIGRETSRLPQSVDSRLTDGSEVVSLRRRPLFTPPQEDSWYSFLLEAESTQGP
jgi:hypothetical protein